MLLKTAKSYIKYVAVAGPTFSMNRGEMPNEWKRDRTYETYVMIHQEVAERLQVVHINTRKHFQDFIIEKINNGLVPKELERVHDWDQFDKLEGGILTFDGQHTHEEGTKIMVQLFADHLQGFDIWGDSTSSSPASAKVTASESESEKDAEIASESNREGNGASGSKSLKQSGGQSYQAEKVQKLGELNDRLASNPELVLNAKMEEKDVEESGYAAVEAARCKRRGCKKGYIIGLDDPETQRSKGRT